MIIENINEYLYKNRKSIITCLVTSFVMGIICHGYCYFNQFYSHDSIGVYADNGEALWQLSLGRFLVGAQMVIRGVYSSATMIGFLSLLFLAIAAYMIFKLLNINNLSMQIIATSILVTYASLTFSNATYIFLSDIYMLALLFAVISVYLIRKNNYLKYLAIITIAITCGLYQSYLFVMTGLLCFLAIKDLIDGKTYKEVLMDILKYILISIIGMILYYVLLLFVRNVSHVGAHASENSISQIGNLSIFNLPSLIYRTYYHFITKFINPNVYHPKFIRLIIFLIFLLTTYLGVEEFLHLKLKERILAIILVLLLPLALDGIYILVNGTIHDLMTYQLSLVYIIVIYFISNNNNIKYSKLISLIVVASLMLICFDSVVYANQIYIKKDLEYQRSKEIANRIIYHIEDIDEYKHGVTPIAFIGCMSDSDLFSQYEKMPYDAVGIVESSALTYFKTYDKYYNDQLNYNLNLLDEDKCRDLEKTSEVKNMEYYPNKNSIKYINGIVVVKISDFKD